MSKIWTKEEDKKLIELYKQNIPTKEISKIIGRAESGVRNRAWRLEITNNNSYTKQEIKYLIENYSSERLQEVANHLGKHKTNVCRKAKELGLDVKTIDFDNLKHFKDEQGNYRKVGWKRETKEEKKERLSKQSKQAYIDNPQLAIDSSKRTKQYIKEIGHPKGMLGKTHSEEIRNNMSKRMVKEWENPDSIFNSEEHKQKQSDLMHKRVISQKQSNPYSRTKSGKRKDLNNLFVRSSWEANYARYLNFLKEKGHIYKWEYEADVFIFEEIKRGTRSYTPDFKIWGKEGSIPYYVEVKGWMDDKSKTKLKRMKKYYPNIKVELVQKEEYNELKKKISHWIKEWE